MSLYKYHYILNWHGNPVSTQIYFVLFWLFGGVLQTYNDKAASKPQRFVLWVPAAIHLHSWTCRWDNRQVRTNQTASQNHLAFCGWDQQLPGRVCYVYWKIKVNRPQVSTSYLFLLPKEEGWLVSATTGFKFQWRYHQIPLTLSNGPSPRISKKIRKQFPIPAFQGPFQ